MKILFYLFIYSNILDLSSSECHKKGKLIKKKRKKQIILSGEPPKEFILLPPSITAIKNLSYCPYYSPKEKEFAEMPIRYKHGISIIITAYKMEKFIKETLDSISNQTWFKKNENWEIIVGIDGCNNTLKTVFSIMKNYKNLRVFMMEENKGTYITTNSMMSIAKYDNLLRFDADDIMMPNLVELTMNESESSDVDRIMFKSKNFGNNSTSIGWAVGQIFMKHWVFDYFGGFMPWKCEGDREFINRIDQFLIIKHINKVLMKRRIHDSNLTVNNETGLYSIFRRWHKSYRINVSMKIKNINQAVIIKTIDNYYEIFSDSII